MVMAPSACAQRIGDLCAAFKLPTVAAEAVPHFREAGHADALETLLDRTSRVEERNQLQNGRDGPFVPSTGCLV